MKNKQLAKGLLAVFTLLALIGCNKEKNTITEYIGRVVEGSTINPLSNVKVSVANESRVLVSTVTNEDGAFSMYVNFEKVNERDSLIIDGRPDFPYQKKYELKGMGKEKYDYRNLVLFNKSNTEVWTSEVTSFTATTAECGGVVNEGTDMLVTQRGVCWSKYPEPTLLNNNFTIDGSGGGIFSSHITGLEERTTYYVKAYAKNGERILYGNQETFTTAALFASFQYAGATYYVCPDAGEMTWQNAMRFCDSLTSAGYSDWYLPDQDELNAMYVFRNEIGGFDLTGQYWSSTIYYYNYGEYTGKAYYQWFETGHQSYDDQNNMKRVRPIRKNGGGGSTPVLVTNEPLYVTSSSARCSGDVISSGGTTIIERGICYSTFSYPTTDGDIVKCGNGTGPFACTISGLSNNTTYYFRAYAKNNTNTYYGNIVEFRTNDEGEGSLHYDNGFSYDFSGGGVGFEDGGVIYWGAMFPPSMLGYYDGMSLCEVEACLCEVGTYYLRVYCDGTTSPSSLAYSDSFSVTRAGWNVVPLSSPVLLNTAKPLWVTFSCNHSTGQYPAGFCYNNSTTNPNGRWISNGSGIWEDSEDYTWSIHAFVSSDSKGRAPVEINEFGATIKNESTNDQRHLKTRLTCK